MYRGDMTEGQKPISTSMSDENETQSVIPFEDNLTVQKEQASELSSGQLSSGDIEKTGDKIEEVISDLDSPLVIGVSTGDVAVSSPRSESPKTEDRQTKKDEEKTGIGDKLHQKFSDLDSPLVMGVSTGEVAVSSPRSESAKIDDRLTKKGDQNTEIGDKVHQELSNLDSPLVMGVNTGDEVAFSPRSEGAKIDDRESKEDDAKTGIGDQLHDVITDLDSPLAIGIKTGDEATFSPRTESTKTEDRESKEDDAKTGIGDQLHDVITDLDSPSIMQINKINESASSSPVSLNVEPEERPTKKDDKKKLVADDSFENMEAEIIKAFSKEEILKKYEMRDFEDEVPQEADPPEVCFDEDYSVLNDTRLSMTEHLDMGNIDFLRDLQKLAKLRELEFENKQALKLLEVETSIQLANEMSLTPDNEYEQCLFPDEKEQIELKPEELVEVKSELAELEDIKMLPELSTIDSIRILPELMRMESSDLSEEEGFRQRLSCILEENESDTSGSGGVIKNLKRLEQDQIASKANETLQNKAANVDEIQEQLKTPIEPELISDVLNSVETNEGESGVTMKELQEVSGTVNEQIEASVDNHVEHATNPKTLEKMDSVDTTESASPEPRQEPGFGIQRLKSGSHVEKLLTRPVVLKRRDSSSDSSLDISVATSTPGADGDVLIAEVDLETVSNPVQTNVYVEMESTVEEAEPVKEEPQESYNIMELSEDELKTMFPKVRRGRRGKSVDTGQSEKLLEEKKLRKKKSNAETSSQKGGDDDRPPVPPETYLWEELRRWRMKGGYPWTYLDKPPFDEKTWKKMKDHEYEPINPPPLETNVEKLGKDVETESEERHFLRIPRDDELVVSEEDMEVEAIAAAQDLQDEMDGRFLATTPMTNATSRTDCDVNTSMLDSSGLEDLPLKRDSRSKKAIQSKTEQMRAQAQGIQQRLRSQAGKLRNKLRSIPRPSFQRKQDKPKQENEEKPRFRLPDRPKFNLPDRSKFKMPKKPNISLPNFAKPLRERQNQGGAKKNIFDIDFKTYPKMFSKKSKDRGDYATSSPKMQRSATPPPAPIQPVRKKGPVGQRWVNRFDDIKYVDDRESEMSRRSDRSESLSGFNEKDFAIADDMDHVQLPPARTLSTKSSLSHLSDREIQSSRSSEDRLRKGVIEEIDSDQFFLRQKGISEENIDMGKYLSNEIREAFKSPVVNALRQLDYDYNPTIEKENMQEKENVEVIEPLPPTRTRSLKKTPKRDIPDKEARPTKTPSPVEILDKPRYENVEEDNTSEYYKSPPPPIEYQHYKVPKPVRPTPVKRKASNSEQSINKKKQNGWVEVEIETSFEEVQPQPTTPQPLKRRKSKKGLGDAQLSVEEAMIEAKNEEPEPDYIIPEEMPPAAPVRTRSLSRGARSVRSLAQEEELSKPVPPKRTSSKSLHSLGLGNEPKTFKRDIDSRSLHSWSAQEASKTLEAPKRTKSLTRKTKSNHSLISDDRHGLPERQPLPPERTRSLSRASRSYHSIDAGDDLKNPPQAPERTRSLSRCSKGKNSNPCQVETTVVIERSHHYEAAPDDGYAVVDKGGNKPKPPRPPPPRRKKGSPSPVFNTFPRRSPIRPVRNYATLGPSRPPRKTKAKPAKSLEHIYTSDQMIVENLLTPDRVDDLHGSNKDLQAEEVVEKMKVRPLPAPPRPPRLKSKSEDQNVSLEEVEEVCVSTQTDPLPDDVCLEDDIIQEFSHDQLRMQEVFLEEMKAEEERIQREIEEKRAKKLDVSVEEAENVAKMQIIRQMDDIIQEEKRLLLDQRPIGFQFHDAEDGVEETKKLDQLLISEDDMGYASLDRRQTRTEEEPQPSTSTQEPPSQAQVPIETRGPVYIPLVPEIVSTETLRVGALEVERLRVNELQATNLQVQNIRSQLYEPQEVRAITLQVQDVQTRTGNISLGNIEIPPDLVQQILLRIPWEELRPPPLPVDPVEEPTTHLGRKQQLEVDGAQQTQSQPQPGTTRRRHRQLKQSRPHYSSDDEADARQVVRRHPRAAVPEQTITDLSRQLAKACTSASLRAMRQFAAHIQPSTESEDRTQYIQVILCVVLIAIAGFIILSLNGTDVHHHHWDFQFPPQPKEQ